MNDKEDLEFLGYVTKPADILAHVRGGADICVSRETLTQRLAIRLHEGLPTEVTERILAEWPEAPKQPTANNLNALAAECHAIAVSKGFWDGPRNQGEVVALIHSEASELLEAFRKDDIANAAEEAADILIRVLDMASGFGMDLDEAVRAKMEKNRSRPHKHGKAF